jgi:hypothetical protein
MGRELGTKGWRLGWRGRRPWQARVFAPMKFDFSMGRRRSGLCANAKRALDVEEEAANPSLSHEWITINISIHLRRVIGLKFFFYNYSILLQT